MVSSSSPGYGGGVAPQSSFPAAPRASATLGLCPSHQHLDLLLEEVDLVLLLNQLLLLLGDLVRHGVDRGITDGPGPPPVPVPA